MSCRGLVAQGDSEEVDERCVGIRVPLERRRASLLPLAFWAACVAVLFSRTARAEDYDIDQATVRVLCSNGYDMESVKLGNAEALLATPKLVHGSGFVAGKKGVIVTARHVVAEAKFVIVLVPGIDHPLPAKVVHTDEKLDVAFLRVNEKVPVRADWKGAKQLEVRQKVFAVGYPLDSTRSDAQSFEGAVSSTMPDGNLQLSLSVNAGNSGGPVVDEKGRVHAIVTRGANVRAGVTGVAVATPVAAFKEALIREVYDKRPGQLEALGDEAALRAADLLVLEQTEATSLLGAATDLASARARAAEEKLRGYSKLAAKSPFVALYMAAFFWNQHAALSARGRPADSPRANAKTLVETALRLDPSRASTFTETVRSDRPAASAPREPEPQVVGTVSRQQTVQFVAPEGVSLLGHLGKLQGMVTTQQGTVAFQQDLYERVCRGSCQVSFEPGEFELALSLDDGQAVPVEGPVKLDGSSDMHASYVDKSGTRTGGLVVFLGGVVGGTLIGVISLVPNCDRTGKDCERNNLGVIAGAAGIGLGVGLGLPMMFSSDEVDVKLVPRGPAAGHTAARAERGATLEFDGRF